MLSAIVLAAGLSTRMGDDNKLLLYYKNKPVITGVVETLLAAGIKDIVIVTGHEAKQVKNVLIDLAVQFVYNPVYAEGMTTSIQHGVANARGSGYMICLSDMVTITAAEFNFLMNAYEKNVLLNAKCICLPRYKNEVGNPVMFSSFYKEAILQNQQKEGCKNIVQSNKENIYWVEMDTPHILQDFDYPDDFKKLVI